MSENMEKETRKKEDTEKKKETLREYLEEKSELCYWANRVAQLEKLSPYRSPTASYVPSRSGPADPTESTVISLEAAKENVKISEERCKESMERVMSIIRTAPKAVHRIVLTRRYIDGMTVDEIADAEFKGRTWATNTLKAATESLTL